MSTNKQGNNAVAKFIYEFSSRGISVALPLDSSLPYDLIIDLNGKLQKVQTKSASRSTDELLIVKLQRTHLLAESRVYKNYTRTDFDLLAVYDTYRDDCYILTYPHWENKTTLNLRYLPTKSGQTKGILFASDFRLNVAINI